MKELTLTSKEQTRVQVLNGVLEELWSVREAAEVLGVSERHTWRLLAAYRKDGAAALAHGNRGRSPANATPLGTRQRLVAVVRERYARINTTHLAELLGEREGIVLSRSTVRRLVGAAGLPSPRQRRPPRHRARRQRMPQEGMLLQVDGSHHAWLEERGPVLTLLLAIDDATGTVPHACFARQETTEGYLLLVRGIVRKQGIPLALYTDRHVAFVRSGPAFEALPPAQRKPTQLGRALRELGITHIFALSPEAKGRVERANGTFQDRLVVELRLAGAATLEEANCVLNAFLPRFNARFGVPPAEAGSAYRPVPEGLDLDGVLCVKERRWVARDNTVQYHGRVLQLFPGTDRPSYAGIHVEVQERLDGRVLVAYRGKVLTPEDAPPLAATLRARAGAPLPAAGGPAAEEERVRRPRLSPPPGPLAGDTIWYTDPARKDIHSALVRAGMERAREEGKRIGRPKVSERAGFAERFAAVVARMGPDGLSHRQAARDLSIGYATLKRLLDAHSLAQSQELRGGELDTTNASLLTESLNASP